MDNTNTHFGNASVSSSETKDLSYWNHHYKNDDSERPSEFSQYVVQKYLKPDDVVIELGCGAGNDAVLLATHSTEYIGIDRCEIAVARCKEKLKNRPNTAITTVKCGDFTDLKIGDLASKKGRLIIYSRFTFHSISESQGGRLLDNLEKIQEKPWLFLLEARTIYDKLYGVGEPLDRHAFRTDHYRRFIDPEEFRQDASARFHLNSFEVSAGFSPVRNEDPILLRAVFSPISSHEKK
jgi:SAM-dependent methyltransferase